MPRPLTEEEMEAARIEFEMAKAHLEECKRIVDELFPEDEDKRKPSTPPANVYYGERGET